MSQFVPFDRVIVLALDSVCWDVLLPFVADKTMLYKATAGKSGTAK